MKYFDPWFFLIGFGIGMFVIYIIQQSPDILVKYPNPDTADTLVYQDEVGSCYKYRPREVQCTGNEKNMKVQT